MKDFDIKKVIGPLDTSKAVEGTTYYFNDTLDGLQHEEEVHLLVSISCNIDSPFRAISGDYRYIYPYEKKYVPFTMDDAAGIIGKVVKNRYNDFTMMITKCCTDDNGDVIINDDRSKDLLESYTFLDGTPCGEEVE